MTRHQRRKLARGRKNAKAETLNSRALLVLQREKTKANLSTAPHAKRSGKLGNRSVYTGACGATAKGASGKKLFDVANDELRSRTKPRRRAHSQFNGDLLSIEGIGLSAAKTRDGYANDLPNCQKPCFKGPFRLKPRD